MLKSFFTIRLPPGSDDRKNNSILFLKLYDLPRLRRFDCHLRPYLLKIEIDHGNRAIVAYDVCGQAFDVDASQNTWV